MNFQKVLDFWFKEITTEQWWKKDESFDQLIYERFSSLHKEAARSELYEWRETPQGRLAEIIVLDQFSRNMYRNTPQSFAQDPLALCLAQEAVSQDADKNMTTKEKSFLYMPYMHSESLKIHEEALKLYSQEGLEYNLDFEHKHKVIIEKFGRYPHRNKILNRESTPEELAFLEQPGSSF